MRSIFVFSICLSLLQPALYAQDFAAPAINPFNLTTQGARSSPFFVDLDDDGDQDIFTGFESGDFGFFDNIGSSNVPDYGPVVINPFLISPLGGSSAPVFGDLDNDGDFDLLTGSSSGLRYYENVGNANIASFGIATANPFGIIDPPGNLKPSLVDIDNDDDLDLFVGATNGNTYFFENTGNINAPAFPASVTNPLGLSNVGNRSAPEFTDLDGDGDSDAMIGNQSGQMNYFENIGTANAPNFSFVSQNPFNISSVGQDAKPNFADLDDDGDADLISGNAVGENYYFENIAPLGFESQQQATSARIFPNPFNEFTIIEIYNLHGDVHTIYLTDLSGRIISIRQGTSENGKILLHREELKGGLYLLFAEDELSYQFLGKVLIF